MREKGRARHKGIENERKKNRTWMRVVLWERKVGEIKKDKERKATIDIDVNELDFPSPMSMFLVRTNRV